MKKLVFLLMALLSFSVLAFGQGTTGIKVSGPTAVVLMAGLFICAIIYHWRFERLTKKNNIDSSMISEERGSIPLEYNQIYSRFEEVFRNQFPGVTSFKIEKVTVGEISGWILIGDNPQKRYSRGIPGFLATIKLPGKYNHVNPIHILEDGSFVKGTKSPIPGVMSFCNKRTLLRDGTVVPFGQDIIPDAQESSPAKIIPSILGIVIIFFCSSFADMGGGNTVEDWTVAIPSLCVILVLLSPFILITGVRALKTISKKQ